jgi:hypothetical protein
LSEADRDQVLEDFKKIQDAGELQPRSRNLEMSEPSPGSSEPSKNKLVLPLRSGAVK